jgi:hypothetical protein
VMTRPGATSIVLGDRAPRSFNRFPEHSPSRAFSGSDARGPPLRAYAYASLYARLTARRQVPFDASACHSIRLAALNHCARTGDEGFFTRPGWPPCYLHTWNVSCARLLSPEGLIIRLCRFNGNTGIHSRAHR